MKKYPVTFSKQAIYEVQEIIQFYADRNAPAFIDQLSLAVEYLTEFPSLGSLLFSARLEQKNVRSLALKLFPYLLFYSFDGETIHILTVVHGRRDIASLLEDFEDY